MIVQILAPTSGTCTSFSVVVTLFISLPSGLYQESVGVGTPSERHFKVTVWPIQDFLDDVVTF